LGLFLYATVRIYRESEAIRFGPIVTIPAWVLTGLFILLLIYSLFLEVHFTKTYGKKEHNSELVTTGTYALSRHPGVLWLFLVFMGLFLATGRSSLFMAGFVFTVINIFYVVLQEVAIFPKLFKDYGDYQKTTPFLLPTLESIKRMFKTWGDKS